MIKVYDKAQWHLDGGENKREVLNKFANIFKFLLKNNMLNEEGNEIVKDGIDSSVSLNEQVVNEEGKKFLNKYYDDTLNCNSNEIYQCLEKYLKNQ